MPIGNSRKWLVGSLSFLAFVAVSRGSWAADEAPLGEMLQNAPSDSAPLGLQDQSKPLIPQDQSTPLGPLDQSKPLDIQNGTKPFGIQDESKNQPIPATSPTPAVGEGDCTSFCGMPLCSPPGRFWLRADALMWWTNGTHLPLLVTSNSTGNTPAPFQTGTTAAFGNDTYLTEGRGGIRLTLGGWLDRCHRWGIEADWFSIAGGSVDYSNTSNGNPAVGRPFFNVETNQWDRQIVAETNSTSGVITSGTVTVHDGDSFDSAGFSVRYNLCCCCGCGCDPCGGSDCGSCGGKGDACNLGDCCDLNMNYCRTDLLFGYRHYSLRDGLTIGENINSVGINTLVTDNFSTHNDFNGAELGLNTELRRGRWSLNILTKMAFGNNHQNTDINGSTVISSITPPTNPTYYPVGIYAVGTNSGIYEKDTFVVIPQLGLEVGYQVTCHTRAYLGYNLLYWGNVMRAGDQIDEYIDPRNFANASDAANALPFPRYPDRSSSFWAQGVNLGLEVRF